MQLKCSYAVCEVSAGAYFLASCLLKIFCEIYQIGFFLYLGVIGVVVVYAVL